MINNKKVIVSIVIVVLILVVLGGIFYFVNKKVDNPTTTLISTDQKFSIEIPNSIKYRINTAPNNDFTIDLFSEKDEMFMYATTIEKSRELDLYDVANDDKSAYFKDKENLREDSRYYQN